MAKIFVSDEIEPLRKVLVHRPDTGISRISPRKAEELLYHDPYISGQTSGTDSFYINASSAVLGLLTEIEEESYRLQSLPGSLDTYWPGLEYRIELQNKNIDYIDSLLSGSSISALLRLQLIEDRKDAVDTISTLYTALTDSYDSLSTIINGEISSLLTGNNSISAGSDSIAIFEKTINQIYLETGISGVDTLTSVQASAVYAIANRCPMIYGGVVYRARALYELKEHIYFDDETLCPPPPVLKKDNINDYELYSKATNFKLLPNPARNEVRIVWDEQPKGEIYVEFLNINGQVVKREKTTAGVKEHNILLSSLSKGLYLVRILNESSIIGTQKLIILD